MLISSLNDRLDLRIDQGQSLSHGGNQRLPIGAKGVFIATAYFTTLLAE